MRNEDWPSVVLDIPGSQDLYFPVGEDLTQIYLWKNSPSFTFIQLDILIELGWSKGTGQNLRWPRHIFSLATKG